MLKFSFSFMVKVIFENERVVNIILNIAPRLANNNLLGHYTSKRMNLWRRSKGSGVQEVEG